MRRERIAALLVVLPMVVLSVSIAWMARATRNGVHDPDAVVFNLTGVASSGVWTLASVSGLNYWWKSFEPATLYLHEGDDVVIHLRSADVLHRFYIPAFSVGPVDVSPGHLTTVRFRAESPGVYQYYCTSMCGGCHFYMRGWIVVTADGEEPVRPPPITCTLCRPHGERPGGLDSLVALGAYLYLEKGCVTCHGPEGQGGIANPNSVNSPVPAHDTTAQKLFLASHEDGEAFIELVSATGDLDGLEDDPEISRFPVVRARFDNAKQIIRGGRYSSKVDPGGPEPPLQMPAWQYLVEEREIDALLVYFVSLYDWEEG
jgi:plastocyanin